MLLFLSCDRREDLMGVPTLVSYSSFKLTRADVRCLPAFITSFDEQCSIVYDSLAETLLLAAALTIYLSIVK